MSTAGLAGTAGIYQHSLADLLRRTAGRIPSKIAIQCGGVSWTYAEFENVCARLAAGLWRSNIRSGDRVAILSRNSHAFAAMRFALARIGAVLVPINFMLNADEIAFILRKLGRNRVGGRPRFRRDRRVPPRPAAARSRPCSGCRARRLRISRSGLIGFDELAARRHVGDPGRGRRARDLAQIVYTSGTESLPKGAMLTHEAVIWQYVSCVIDGEMAADDVMLHALPLYHCAQLDVFLGPAVYLGRHATSSRAQPTPDRLLPLIARHGITSFFAPPTVWIALLRSPLFDTTDLSTLRKGYYGASIMPVEVLREMQQRLPDVRLWNFYGQTEIAPLATVLEPEDQLRKARFGGQAGAQRRDPRRRRRPWRMCAPGEVGEIVHRSPQLMRGYYDDPEKTAAAFDGGWFHSGDLATVDEDGYITVVDRKKDMIKTGGENVASREVEEMIYRLPAVSEVAVVGLPDPHWIEAVTAVVVVKAGQSLDVDTVVGHCHQHMAAVQGAEACDLCRQPAQEPERQAAQA